MSTVFNDQDIDFDNIKFKNLGSNTIIRNPSSDEDLANK